MIAIYCGLDCFIQLLPKAALFRGENYELFNCIEFVRFCMHQNLFELQKRGCSHLVDLFIYFQTSFSFYKNLVLKWLNPHK